MKQLRLNVLMPAMMPNHTGVMPDPVPNYLIPAFLPPGVRTINIGPALVTLGTKVGNKWLGCTYIKAPFVIPGFCEIEEIGI